MKAVIMAGGKGTRLRPLTCGTPKPMVPLLDRPVMEYAIELLKRYGITDIAVTMQYLPEVIRSHFGDGSELGVRLHYFDEEEPLGTAGSVKNAEDFLDETFIVISGDALTDFDLGRAVGFHREREAMATLVLTRVDHPLEYGVVMTDEEGSVIRFLEKPGWGEVFSDTVNTGIYILEPHVLTYVEKGREFDFSKDLFPFLMRAGMPLYGYVAEGYWSDIGNLPQYRQTQFDMLEGKVRVDIRGTEVFPGVWVGGGVKIDAGLSMTGPAFIGDGCVVEDHVEIGGRTVIGRGSLIGRGARLEGAVLWSHAAIGAQASLAGATLCRNATVGSDTAVAEGAVIGDAARIGRKCVIKEGVKVWPNKTVGDHTFLNQSFMAGEYRGAPLFGQDGIRGEPWADLTPPFAAKLALAYASVLPAGATVAVGSDGSPCARVLEGILAETLLASGQDVLELGTVNGAVSRFVTQQWESAGGIYLRRVCGDEVSVEFWDGEGLPIDRNLERKIENAFAQEDSRKIRPELIGRRKPVPEGWRRYMDRLLSCVRIEEIGLGKPTAVVCGGPRAMEPWLAELEKALGLRIVRLADAADSAAVADWVRRCGADLGIGLDADGRLTALADEAGEIVEEERLDVLQLMLRLREAGAGGTLSVPVHVSDAAEELAARHGLEIVRTKSDRRSRMAAGGSRGLHAEFDGLFALALLLDAMAREDRPLSQLVHDLSAFERCRRKVDCPWQDKGKVMRCLMEETKGRTVELVDGIKVRHGEASALILPDGSEPLVHVLVHAPTRREAEELAESYARKVEEFCGQVRSPAERSPVHQAVHPD